MVKYQISLKICTYQNNSALTAFVPRRAKNSPSILIFRENCIIWGDRNLWVYCRDFLNFPVRARGWSPPPRLKKIGQNSGKNKIFWVTMSKKVLLYENIPCGTCFYTLLCEKSYLCSHFARIILPKLYNLGKFNITIFCRSYHLKKFGHFPFRENPTQKQTNWSPCLMAMSLTSYPHYNIFFIVRHDHIS